MAAQLLHCSSDSSMNGSTDDTSPSDAAQADAPPPANHALSFAGTADYATTGTADFPAGNAAKTISMWVRYASASRTQVFFVMRNDSGGGLKLGLRNGALSAWTVLEGKTLVAAPVLPVVDKWHHISYVFDGKANALYVDGKEIAKSAQREDDNPYIASWLGSADGTAEFYSGALDEIRLWTVARTSAQLAKEMMGQVDSTEYGLVLDLDCDAVFGSRLPDKSRKGNDATLGGGDPMRMPLLVSSDVPLKS